MSTKYAGNFAANFIMQKLLTFSAKKIKCSVCAYNVLKTDPLSSIYIIISIKHFSISLFVVAEKRNKLPKSDTNLDFSLHINDHTACFVY